MKYQIVLQWSTSSMADYDRVIEIEGLLIDGISKSNEVDGHDSGSGEANIFVHTNDVHLAVDEIKDCLGKNAALEGVRIGYRELDGDEYFPLWPKELKRFAVA
jgi:hypothetical protein